MREIECRPRLLEDLDWAWQHTPVFWAIPEAEAGESTWYQEFEASLSNTEKQDYDSKKQKKSGKK
jgi:hypothetical protein